MENRIDIDELDCVATEASTPDEWRWRRDDLTHELCLEGKHDGQIVLYADQNVGLTVSHHDRAHIAAASPPVVRALVARIRELEAALRLTSDAIAPQTGYAIGVILDRGVVLR